MLQREAEQVKESFCLLWSYNQEDIRARASGLLSGMVSKPSTLLGSPCGPQPHCGTAMPPRQPGQHRFQEAQDLLLALPAPCWVSSFPLGARDFPQENPNCCLSPGEEPQSPAAR